MSGTAVVQRSEGMRERREKGESEQERAGGG